MLQLLQLQPHATGTAIRCKLYIFLRTKFFESGKKSDQRLIFSGLLFKSKKASYFHSLQSNDKKISLDEKKEERRRNQKKGSPVSFFSSPGDDWPNFQLVE